MKNNTTKRVKYGSLNWIALDINCNCEGDWLQKRIELMKKCCSEAILASENFIL